MKQNKSVGTNLQEVAEFRVILDLCATAQRKHFKKEAISFFLSKINPARYPYNHCMAMTKIALAEVFRNELTAKTFVHLKDLPTIKRMVESEKEFLQTHYSDYKKKVA
jgi:hypothetical protein